MSKERDLLVSCLDEFRYHEVPCSDLIRTIHWLLNIPEQTEQEPVAWMSLSDIEWMNIVNNPKILELTDGRHNSEEAVNLAVKMTEEKCKKNNSDSIPKREPLSDEAVGNLLMDGFSTHLMDLVRMVEKAHGIGGTDV